MFAVIFEVQPRAGQRDAYLGRGRLLKPELEAVEGFVDNVRYRSLTREGLILSLSSWRDEKSVVRWRTQSRHHEAQAQGRETILADYHLRVGEITQDTQLPAGHTLRQQRLDETEVGGGNGRVADHDERSSRSASRASRLRPWPAISAWTRKRPGGSAGTSSMPSSPPAISSCCAPGAMRRRPRPARGRRRQPPMRGRAAYASCATMGCSIGARHRSFILLGRIAP